MAIPDENRGVGAWFKRKREQHGYGSQRKLLDAMRARGIPVPESATSVYAEIESRGLINTPARRKLAERVAAFYGETMPEPLAGTGQGSAELVLALTRQTDAINALVEEMRLARIRDEDAAAAMMRAAELVLSAQRLAADGASTTPDAPLGTGR